MLFRTRILQDVAEYAIRTADQGANAGVPAVGTSFGEPPAIQLRGERTSSHLTSASAIALGPWAVFALSFLILSAYREEIEQALDLRMSNTIDIDGLGDLSRVLAGEPDAIPMFGQAQATSLVGAVTSDIVADAPSFKAEPNLSAHMNTGPFAATMLPDETFEFDLNAARRGLAQILGERETDGSRYLEFSGKRAHEQADASNPYDGDPNHGGDNGDATGSGAGEILQGTVGANFMVGTTGDDVIFGYDGDDSITGKSGNDVIFAGAGQNTVDGSSGLDAAAFTGAAVDYVLTRNDDGSLLVENHQTGDSAVLVNIEFLYFKDGRYDVSELPDGIGRLETGNLLDTSITAFDLLDELGLSDMDPDDGTRGEIVKGDEGDNVLIGTDRDDIIFGGGGNDMLDGRDGNDILVPGHGNDVVAGGAGYDAAAFLAASKEFALHLDDAGVFFLKNQATGEVTVLTEVERLYFTDGFVELGDIGSKPQVIDLAAWLDPSMTVQDLIDQTTGGGDGGGDDGEDGQILLPTPSITGERLDGTAGDDDLSGAENNDLILGYDGNDRLAGRDGNDIFVPGAGNDLIDGGSGLDSAVFLGASTDYTLYRMSDGSFSLVNDRTEEETLLYDVDVLFFSDGFLATSLVKADGVVPLDNLLDAGKTSLEVLSQVGVEVSEDGQVEKPAMPASSTETGFAIYGDDRDNELTGSERDDTFFPGAGNDLVSGRDGADLFVVGPGYNFVDGGNGRDAVAFHEKSSDYSLYAMSDGSFSLVNERSAEETTLRDVEGIFFSDGFVDISELGRDAGRIDIASFLDGSVTSRDMIENSGTSGYGAPIDGGYLFRGDDGDNDIIGTHLDDFILTGGGDDLVNAQGGDDIVIAGRGRNLIDGGEGHDIVGIDGTWSNYRLYDNGDGSFAVEDSKHGDVIQLMNVEGLYFNDGNVDLTGLSGKGGEVYIGDLLDTDATVGDIVDLGRLYPEYSLKQPPPDDPKILVFDAPPLVLAPIEELTHPDTGEKV